MLENKIELMFNTLTRFCITGTDILIDIKFSTGLFSSPANYTYIQIIIASSTTINVETNIFYCAN